MQRRRFLDSRPSMSSENGISSSTNPPKAPLENSHRSLICFNRDNFSPTQVTMACQFLNEPDIPTAWINQSHECNPHPSKAKLSESAVLPLWSNIRWCNLEMCEWEGKPNLILPPMRRPVQNKLVATSASLSFSNWIFSPKAPGSSPSTTLLSSGSSFSDAGQARWSQHTRALSVSPQIEGRGETGRLNKWLEIGRGASDWTPSWNSRFWGQWGKNEKELLGRHKRTTNPGRRFSWDRNTRFATRYLVSSQFENWIIRCQIWDWRRKWWKHMERWFFSAEYARLFVSGIRIGMEREVNRKAIVPMKAGVSFIWENSLEWVDKVRVESTSLQCCKRILQKHDFTPRLGLIGWPGCIVNRRRVYRGVSRNKVICQIGFWFVMFPAWRPHKSVNLTNEPLSLGQVSLHKHFTTCSPNQNFRQPKRVLKRYILWFVVETIKIGIGSSLSLKLIPKSIIINNQKQKIKIEAQMPGIYMNQSAERPWKRKPIKRQPQ